MASAMDTTPDRPSGVAVPVSWSAKDKSPLLDVQQGLRVMYLGEGDTEKDAASVRANCAIPPSCGLFYFEVEITDKGKEGYIGVGLCGATAGMNRLPGWEKCSYGYHGDDGNSFCCTGSQGTKYGPTFTTGDVIGCCLNLTDMSCFYTKNGVDLGVAFRNVGVNQEGESPTPLFPCVGLQTKGAEVKANFGQQPFVYDLESYKSELRKQARKMVEDTVLPESLTGRTVNQLVSSYLVHYGYDDTARAFARAAGVEIEESEESISTRKEVWQLVVNGQIDDAIAIIMDRCEGVFAANPQLLFRLRCRKFVEMVSKPDATQGDSLADVMDFGQSLQQMCDALDGDSRECQGLLKEVFSLLAYADLAASPLSHLLADEHRLPLADEVNSALLAHQSQPTRPALENMVRHSVVCLEEMRKHGVGTAAFVDAADFLQAE